MEKELLKLKKYFNRILNTNVEDYYSLYKDQDEKYNTNSEELNWLQTLASDGLKSVEIIQKLLKEK